ncbi:MAG: NAD(P)H-dependent glycerol-3-phosphate dehydrogenase [Candidatus Electryonea clarkiae]|nr:NAD(P)H-dependent glycerol-3-phosphate dehydrogenase [Candidatus Electryonea clarkiae]MDP8288195.1 NAD(P)H-dependent glycerol-3-phosphate dehydrogenase [Candidatus Electryonea clarkiae]
MAEIAVLGAGSWGTSLAILLAEQNEHKVRLWEFRPDAAKALAEERINREFLPGIPFPEDIEVFNDIEDSLHGVDAVLIVVPSQFVRSAFERIKNIPNNAIWIGASKGVENNSLLRMSQVAGDVLGSEVEKRFVAFSGPSHAEEVSNNLPTTVVAACPDLELARTVQHWFSTPTFRTYASEDLIGVELGGATKNVMAIATGMCDGLGFGDNTRGALMTRGLAEMARLGIAMGAKLETYAGLSGIGDLITTCTSKHSRNRFVGEELGKGRALKSILDTMIMVAEGVATTISVYDLSKEVGIEMPITEQVYRILFEDASPREAVMQLMTRSLKVE